MKCANRNKFYQIFTTFDDENVACTEIQIAAILKCIYNCFYRGTLRVKHIAVHVRILAIVHRYL